MSIAVDGVLDFMVYTSLPKLSNILKINGVAVFS